MTDEGWITNPKGDEHAAGMIAGAKAEFMSMMERANEAFLQHDCWIVRDGDTLTLCGGDWQLSVGPLREDRPEGQVR